MVRCPLLPHDDDGHVALCFSVVLEEAGDVVPAEVEGFDARWRARDAPHGASGQLQGQARLGRPASPSPRCPAPSRDGSIEAFQSLASVLHSEEPLEVDGPLVEAHP
jgi:hypothetical protein